MGDVAKESMHKYRRSIKLKQYFNTNYIDDKSVTSQL